MPIRLTARLCCLSLALAGCSAVSTDGSLFGVLSPYRIEVVQGNVVTSEMAAELRPGLTREQVRSLLGAPLLADAFHANRWDYVFSIRRQGTPPQQRRVTVFFDEDRLARFVADSLPSEQAFVTSIDTTKNRRAAPPLELTDAQLKALPLPAMAAASDAVAPPPAGPQRAYPPLEPVDR